MAIVWGDFDTTALCYIKRLASETELDPIWFEDGPDGPYGVATYQEWAQLCERRGPDKLRPVSTMTRVEFMGLLLVRYRDFFPEEKDADTEKSVQAGQQPGN